LLSLSDNKDGNAKQSYYKERIQPIKVHPYKLKAGLIPEVVCRNITNTHISDRDIEAEKQYKYYVKKSWF